MNAKSKLHQVKLSQWTTLIQEQSRSGLTVKDWCMQNNISFHAYNYWKHILKESVVDSVMPDIVPLVSPVPSSAFSDQRNTLSNPSAFSPDLCNSRDRSLPVSVSLGDVRIEIGSNASDDVICSIIKAVRHV